LFWFWFFFALFFFLSHSFPFCTVQPSTSRAFVNDPRFDWLCDNFRPGSKVKGMFLFLLPALL
jgi:ribosome-binding ATPase YchF (GTP1/OBG family)